MFNYAYDELINPTLISIKKLGGSATISEIIEELVNQLEMTEKEVDDIHKGSTTKLEYRSSWARTYLKKAGYITNSSRGVWALTDLGNKTEKVNKTKIKKVVKEAAALNKDGAVAEDNDLSELNWQNKILDVVKSIEPNQFEKLCQRLLRELGFVNVEVSGQSHDGGIDGKGILKLGEILSFHVAFQAKRYSGSVGSSVVRDFRGAIMGRVDKGIIITTGNFTREAHKEAQRDGATPIDLIDGNDLAEHIKKLRLGVKVEMVEKVTVDSNWYTKI